MNRESIKKWFEELGSRITIRTGLGRSGGSVRVNVVNDSKGEHFTLTIHPDVDESKIEILPLDSNKKLRQMLLLLKYPLFDDNGPVLDKHKKEKTVTERLLCGHDEMHWFVEGVTMSKTIEEAFSNLRPASVTMAMHKAGVKNKDKYRRKTKGFIRQGEWFFVPVHFEETKSTVIHKNEPINRRGGSSHIVDELVRMGGTTVWTFANEVLTQSQWENIKDPRRKGLFRQRGIDARVLARGKVKHKDHHTIILKGWHEVLLATNSTASSNAFID
jgi:hypothetical protein